MNTVLLYLPLFISFIVFILGYALKVKTGKVILYGGTAFIIGLGYIVWHYNSGGFDCSSNCIGAPQGVSAAWIILANIFLVFLLSRSKKDNK